MRHCKPKIDTELANDGSVCSEWTLAEGSGKTKAEIIRAQFSTRCKHPQVSDKAILWIRKGR